MATGVCFGKGWWLGLAWRLGAGQRDGLDDGRWGIDNRVRVPPPPIPGSHAGKTEMRELRDQRKGNVRNVEVSCQSARWFLKIKDLPCVRPNISVHD